MKPRILITITAALTFAIASSALAAPIYFNDPITFHEFNIAEGKILKGIETFEESNINPGGKQILPAPFCPGVPNVDPTTGYGFPDGLVEDNICVVDNITPGPSPATVNPSNAAQALYVIGPGFIGSNSKKVGEDLFLFGIQASIDLIFNPEDNHTGVGFWLSRFDGFPNAGWTITTYDKNDNILGVATIPGPGAVEPSKQFFGVWVDPSIGRINIWDPEIAPDAIDDIEMWTPEPSSLALLPLGALALLRRRR